MKVVAVLEPGTKLGYEHRCRSVVLHVSRNDTDTVKVALVRVGVS